MAMTDKTYDGLCSAITDWMVRPDLTVAQVADAVFLFESEMNRRLLQREMETSADLTTVSGTVALPTDFGSWRGLTWNGAESQELDYAHPTAFHGHFASADQDVPAWFTIEGDNLLIRPIDDTADAYSLRYARTLPHLSSAGDEQTNWLLLAHPDLYLAGCLAYAYAFVRDEAAATTYKQLMEQKLLELRDYNERNKAPAELRVVGVIA